MVLVKNFRATTVHKAFALNAVATTFIVIISFLAKDLMDRNYKEISFKNYSVIIISTFVACLSSFYFMHLVFGYGGGMLES
jgi:hypothetical protein